MKKYQLLIAFLCANLTAFAQHIDDAGFAQGIRYHCPKCIDTANNLTDAARIQTSLTVSLLNAADLKGIEGFSTLNSLICTNSKLTTLPANLPPSLQYLNVQFNQITNLPNLPPNLRVLYCSNNQISALPNLPNSMRFLDCSHNKITNLQANLPTELITLFCGNNLLTAIPNLPNNLEGLMCGNNKIKIIPALPASLIRLSCQFTDVKCLPFLDANLMYLDISKDIVCVPNIVTTLTTELYETNSISKTVNLPICNDLRPLPCDTFPRSVTSKDTAKTVNNANLTAKIAVFPNPTEGVVKIKCTNCTIKNVRVFNAFGQLIFETNAAILDFFNLAAAMYLVQVETTNGDKIIEKIMRQ